MDGRIGGTGTHGQSGCLPPRAPRSMEHERKALSLQNPIAALQATRYPMKGAKAGSHQHIRDCAVAPEVWLKLTDGAIATHRSPFVAKRKKPAGSTLTAGFLSSSAFRYTPAPTARVGKAHFQMPGIGTTKRRRIFRYPVRREYSSNNWRGRSSGWRISTKPSLPNR